MAKQLKQTKEPVKDFERLKGNDLKYVVDYDYDTYNACEHGSDCCDNDYCRCGKIVNAHVKADVLTSRAIAKHLTKNQGLHKDPKFYCLERWISCVLRENPDCFDVSTGSGYYGEEVYGVSIEWNQANDINTFVDLMQGNLTQAKLRELVEQVLTREYGYVLPALMNKVWHYDYVSIDKIIPGNKEYHTMTPVAIAKYAEKRYGDKEPLSCLCKNDKGHYVLVDGYHRYSAAKRRGDKGMRVMWCEV